jgi:hypothetical protein
MTITLQPSEAAAIDQRQHPKRTAALQVNLQSLHGGERALLVAGLDLTDMAYHGAGCAASMQ